jgi:flagellar motor switch protein FliN/FliY
MSDETNQDDLAAQWAAALDDKADAGSADNEKLAAEWAAALASTEQKAVTDEKKHEKLRPQAIDATFKDMTDVSRAPRADSTRRELDFILDIPLDVSAELGRTRLLINELLQLGQGSVVELNKLAGEPLEVYVNGKLVARGEAVVINEKFGVRLTDIISPIERVKQLG